MARAFTGKKSKKMYKCPRALRTGMEVRFISTKNKESQTQIRCAVTNCREICPTCPAKAIIFPL